MCGGDPSPENRRGNDHPFELLYLNISCVYSRIVIVDNSLMLNTHSSIYCTVNGGPPQPTASLVG